MNTIKLEQIEDLAFEINFDLAILNSAIKGNEDLEICMLESFISKIYKDSSKIKEIFDESIII